MLLVYKSLLYEPKVMDIADVLYSYSFLPTTRLYQTACAKPEQRWGLSDYVVLENCTSMV